MAHEVFSVTIDGEDHEITESNHTVAMFRDTPEYDYLHLQPEEDLTEEQRHILIFRNQRLCHWMAGLALSETDMGDLAEIEEERGNFKALYGFNSRVMLEDRANDFEVEYYTQGLLKDLEAAEGADDLLG